MEKKTSYNLNPIVTLKNKTLLLVLIVLNVTFITLSFGQKTEKIKSYIQKDFDKNKILDNTYNLKWSKNQWVANPNDTLPNFVDDRNYKGIINYGVSYRGRDFRTFLLLENIWRCFLKIDITHCQFNPKDSIVSIEGLVSGGWDEDKKTGKKLKNYIDIFIGEKTDTMYAAHLGNIVNNKYIEIKWKNREIDSLTVLDSFPSFYYQNYSHTRTFSENKKPFTIKAKTSRKSILAFGGISCYSEIFDIGAMVFEPKKNKRAKKNIQQLTDCQPILTNNKLVADIEKDKNKVLPLYYQLTDKAEGYILLKQYAKAKEQYRLIEENYSKLFAKDMHNAVRCAILSRDTKTAIHWCERLAEKGVGMKYFNAKIFNKIKVSAFWKGFEEKYPELQEKHKVKLDSTYSKKLYALTNEDQSDYGLENRKIPEILYYTTERVTEKLVDFFKKEGLPAEEKVGLVIKNDTIMVISPDYYVIMLHAFQQKPKDYDALKLLLESDSETLTFDFQRSTIKNAYENFCYQIYKGNLYLKTSCSPNKIIEAKIKFMFKNPSGFIIENKQFSVWEYNYEHPQEWDAYFEANYKLIMKLTDDWEFYEK